VEKAVKGGGDLEDVVGGKDLPPRTALQGKDGTWLSWSSKTAAGQLDLCECVGRVRETTPSAGKREGKAGAKLEKVRERGT